MRASPGQPIADGRAGYSQTCRSRCRLVVVVREAETRVTVRNVAGNCLSRRVYDVTARLVRPSVARRALDAYTCHVARNRGPSPVGPMRDRDRRRMTRNYKA